MSRIAGEHRKIGMMTDRSERKVRANEVGPNPSIATAGKIWTIKTAKQSTNSVTRNRCAMHHQSNRQWVGHIGR